jgi:hypothetical protein
LQVRLSLVLRPAVLRPLRIVRVFSHRQLRDTARPKTPEGMPSATDQLSTSIAHEIAATAASVAFLVTASPLSTYVSADLDNDHYGRGQRNTLALRANDQAVRPDNREPRLFETDGTQDLPWMRDDRRTWHQGWRRHASPAGCRPEAGP